MNSQDKTIGLIILGILIAVGWSMLPSNDGGDVSDYGDDGPPPIEAPIGY